MSKIMLNSTRILTIVLKEIEAEEQNKKHSELLSSLKESVEYFETKHPRVTAIINDIMVTLSNMGTRII